MLASDITPNLSLIVSGDSKVFDEVRALVYEELRKLCKPPPWRTMRLCA